MKYVVEAFDKETESLAFEIELPDGCDAQLADIMNWADPQRGDEGYDISGAQMASIEKIAGRQFYSPNYIFQLTCNLA